jgi:membrane protease YdiL (CAAX protease family)
MLWMRAVFGPTHYQPTTAWGPVQALLGMIAAHVLALAVAVAAALVIRKAADPWPLSHFREAVRQGAPLSVAMTLLPRMLLLGLVLAFYVPLIGAAWWLARRGGLRAADALALRTPMGGGNRLLFIGAVAAIVVAAAYAVHYAYEVHYVASRIHASGEARQPDWVDQWDWVGYVRGFGWPLAVLMMGIAGPLAEEVWFRGFLLPAFAKTRVGFWGAGFATSAIFAATHGFQYTLDQLVPLFFIGLVLAWALGLTGSLWVPVAIHMCINLLLLFWVWLSALA